MFKEEYNFYIFVLLVVLVFAEAAWSTHKGIIKDILDFRKWNKFERGEPRIVCSAARNKAGKIIASPRHCDNVYWNTAKLINKNYNNWQGADIEQGFIDQFGNFLTREEAWIIAEKNGQIIARVGGDGKKLFSENLY